MANSTDPFAESVHGTNPQYLVEKITRLKIYNSRYWKESCFGLTSETIVDKAISLKYCGGTYGGSNKPSDFICLILKLLQLQPELDIVIEFIRNEDFKYLRVLGAFYMRLIGKPEDIFHHLEPLYEDYRKIAYRGMAGWSCKHMDEFIDSLLVDELVCDIALPHLPKRMKLEQLGILEERTSILDSELFNSDEPTGAADSINALNPAAVHEIIAKVAEEKKITQPENPADNAEYIKEYRKTDIRNTAGGDKRDNGHDSDKYRSKRNQDRSPNRERNRSRDRQGQDDDAKDRRSSTGTGKRRYESEERQDRSRRVRSRSTDNKRYKVIDRSKGRDGSRSRSRERDRRSDRTSTRKRTVNRDSRSRSRSRSPKSSRHSRRDRSQDRGGASRRYQVKDREYDRRDSKSSTRRRDRSSSYDGRRSRTSRHRSRSSSDSVERKKSKKSTDDRRKRTRSSSSSSSSSRSDSVSSSSRSRSPSPSKSKSHSKKPSESESDLKSKSQSISNNEDTRPSSDDAVDIEEEKNAMLEEKAAAIKAAKAEKKFDKMFKTKKSSASDAPAQGTGKAHPEGSIEYWNQIREGLGIKKLKG